MLLPMTSVHQEILSVLVFPFTIVACRKTTFFFMNNMSNEKLDTTHVFTLNIRLQITAIAIFT